MILEKPEKLALALLIAILLTGSAVLIYRSHHGANFSIDRYGPGLREAAGKKIDINIASASGLMVLKGVGGVLAERIISYREANGRFGSIEEITKVKGVGKALFKKIKDDITV